MRGTRTSLRKALERILPSAETRRPFLLLAGMMGYWGLVDALNGAAAPFMAREFGLDDVAITRTFGWMSLGAIGTYALARWADHTGRRRVLLWTIALLGPLCVASALAPSLEAFVGVQVGLWALKGLLYILVPVMITEVLPIDQRARGQGWAGFAGTLGAGMAFILVPIVAPLPGGWRWVWALGGLALLAVLPLRRMLPESEHFEAASERGDTERVRVRDLLRPRYRARTLAAVVIGGLVPMVVAGTQSWLVYYPIQHLELEPIVATAVVLLGGGVSLVGFPLGGAFSERFGRKPTFALAATLYVFANHLYYHVPKDFPVHPALGLLPSLAALTLFSAAAAVPMRATLTELFPTALRATLQGAVAISAAFGTAFAFFAGSWLSEVLGGLPNASSVLGLGMPLAALLFVLVLPETRGLDLREQDEVLHRETEADDA